MVSARNLFAMSLQAVATFRRGWQKFLAIAPDCIFRLQYAERRYMMLGGKHLTAHRPRRANNGAACELQPGYARWRFLRGPLKSCLWRHTMTTASKTEPTGLELLRKPFQRTRSASCPSPTKRTARKATATGMRRLSWLCLLRTLTMSATRL